MSFNFQQQRILICQPIISYLGGSTVVTIELAEYLQNQGAQVTIYTCSYDQPAKKFCQQKKLTVLTASDQPELHINDFDYIWVNSQILPQSFLTDFKHQQQARFIFCHLSAIDWIPDERPWIYELEEKICSLQLFIAENTKDFNQGFINKTLPYKFFRNPAPDVYATLTPHHSSHYPHKILIVSNHQPAELLVVQRILQHQNIQVQILGEINPKPDLINPQYIADNDVVITIGKTVQYCLVAGTPVYIYDHFGGPGYLDDSNYQQAKEHNFSGRGTNKKDPQTIIEELMNNYQQALQFHRQNRQKFCQEFLLSQTLPDIFVSVPATTIAPFDDKYLKAVSLCQDLAIKYFQTVTREALSKTREKKLGQELHNIYSSKTWQLKKILSHWSAPRRFFKTKIHTFSSRK